MVNLRVFARRMTTVAKSFQANGVVPDVVPVAPTEYISVKFNSGVEAKEGNELTPTQVKDEPEVHYPADPHKFYTLAMVDPDAPSRKNPAMREWQHWMVGNIPGSQVRSGETLSAYIGAGPPEGTGLHRYVYLVYQQPGKVAFSEQRLPNNSADGRAKFSITAFAQKYHLGDPIAGNFFQAQYDDYVPLLYKQLGA